jgi:hypothetical protein
VTSPEPLVLPLAGADLDASLTTLGMLPRDPTVRLRPGHLERATVTPEGTATLLATWSQDVATVRAIGDGAGWLLARAPASSACWTTRAASRRRSSRCATCGGAPR